MVGIFRGDRGWQAKGNVKKLDKQQTAISPLMFFILTIMYTVAYNSSWRAMSWLWYGISLAAIIVLLSVFINNDKVKFNFYTGWAVIFLVYSLMGCLWAINMDPVFEQLKTLGLIFIVHILLAQLIDKREDIEKLLKANFLALFVLLVYVILKTDVSMLGKFRIGVDTLGELWNANDIGLKFCAGFTLALYFMLKKENKIISRLIYALCALAFMVLSLFTGSRKVVIMLVIILFLVFWLRAKRHRILVFMVLVISSVLFIVLIMKIPALYDVLGKRMESLFEGLLGNSGGSSFDTRADMIALGWEWFKQRPIFGYGLSNYSVMYLAETGWSTYSHNNFIEILVSGGLVGFIIYYSVYIYLFIKLIKHAFVQRDLVAIVLGAFNFSVIVMHTALVSYSSTLDNFVLMTTVIYIAMKGRKNENS